jgi:predicted nucleic acid-binding protein
VRPVVLDSSACLAYFFGELCHDEVASLLLAGHRGDRQLSMCVVNLGEVRYWVHRRKGADAAEEATRALPAMGVEVVPADFELTCRAADLKAVTSASYADCFAAALAQVRDAEVATGDPGFARFGAAVQVLWLPTSLPTRDPSE